MKRKITFMMLAIAMLSITSCKASPMREQVNIDCVLQDSVQAILGKYLPDYGVMDGEVIVMETKSGKVLAQVGLNDIGNYSYERADSLAQVTNQMEKLMYYNTIANDKKKTAIHAKLKKIVKKEVDGRNRISLRLREKILQSLMKMVRSQQISVAIFLPTILNIRYSSLCIVRKYLHLVAECQHRYSRRLQNSFMIL